VDFRDTITAPVAEWKQSTKVLTIEVASTAAPSVSMSVTGYGNMTYNTNTGRYVLTVSGVNVNPNTVTIVSDIGGVQAATVRRR
jgi:hypothetical protein